MVFGVLADTAALLTSSELTLLRRAFKGVDAILHAGPVGDLRVSGTTGTIGAHQGGMRQRREFYRPIGDVCQDRLAPGPHHFGAYPW